VKFDPKTADADDWSKYHAYRYKRHQEKSPEDDYLDDDVVTNSVKRDNPMADVMRYQVIDLDKDMAVGSLTMVVLKPGTPNHETNGHLMQVSGALLPVYRGHGLGKKMLKLVLDEAKKLDKQLIIMNSDEEDGKKFLKKIGAEFALQGAENRLNFDTIDWEMVEQWYEDGKAKNPTTTLHNLSIIPEDMIERYCKLSSETSNQQPFDELDVNDMVITPEFIRDREDRFEEMGVTYHVMITEEESGKLSGLTEMIKAPNVNQLSQGLTGVQSEFRGRKLGKYLKAAMLRFVKDKYPDTTVIKTDNADSNEAMLSINNRLGFKRYKSSVNAQITRENLEKYISSKMAVSN